MKKCPFCAEEIQEEAIKCKHCGEFLDSSLARQVANKHGSDMSGLAILGGFLLTGPLVIPLIWMNKKYSLSKKIILTSIIILVSVVLVVILWKLVAAFVGYYKQAFDMLNNT